MTATEIIIEHFATRESVQPLAKMFPGEEWPLVLIATAYPMRWHQAMREQQEQRRLEQQIPKDF